MSYSKSPPLLQSYPKSSCPCQQCIGWSPNNQCKYKEGDIGACSNETPSGVGAFIQREPKPMPLNNTSSIGLTHCQPSSGFYCANKQIYAQDIQPYEGKDYFIPLNKIGLDMAVEQYVPVNCSTTDGSCPYGWAGYNPLLMEPVRGARLLLDRPNYKGDMQVGDSCYDTIYTPFMKNYGKHYTNYGDITGGQIQYYISRDTSDAYFKPLFVTPAVVTHEVFMDPMDNPKPQYNRSSLQPYSWQACKKTECDSFTHDTLEFRQELMEKQMRKRNQQTWEPRWT